MQLMTISHRLKVLDLVLQAVRLIGYACHLQFQLILVAAT